VAVGNYVIGTFTLVINTLVSRIPIKTSLNNYLIPIRIIYNPSLNIDHSRMVIIIRIVLS
jgi:hypothetical protein